MQDEKNEGGIDMTLGGTNPDPSVSPAPNPPPTPAKIVDPIASKPETASGGQTGGVPTNYAGFWIRFIAALIDLAAISLIFILVILLLIILLGGLIESEEGMGLAVFTLPVFLYFPILTSKFGATFGKMAVGLKVVDTNGNKISFWRAVLREYIGKWISNAFFSLGFIWIAFDEKKQGWHDKIAQTYVVKTR